MKVGINLCCDQDSKRNPEVRMCNPSDDGTSSPIQSLKIFAEATYYDKDICKHLEMKKEQEILNGGVVVGSECKRSGVKTSHDPPVEKA